MADAWIEVRTGALKHNLREVRKVVQAPEFCAVVKANGYGHGLEIAAEAFVAAGADRLGVSRLEEALRLRSAGIGAPILCLTPIRNSDLDEAIRHHLHFAVDDPNQLEEISRVARDLDSIAHVHLKVDTGMGRLGVLASQLDPMLDALAAAGRVQLSGVFTHFANATETDRNLTQTQAQWRAFQRVRSEVSARFTGRDVVFHCCNSAATLRLPEAHAGMVRVGTLLYGQSPVPTKMDLRQTWALKARVVSVRDLPAGSTIGYGSEFRTKRSTRIAVVAIGTSDGFTLSPEGPLFRQSVAKFALRKWKRRLSLKFADGSAPVLGRVSMNMTVADVSHLPGVRTDDEVEVPCLRLSAADSLPRVVIP